ncbi:hypothetical protein Ocin01_16753, partial [Orchesella cincta]
MPWTTVHQSNQHLLQNQEFTKLQQKVLRMEASIDHIEGQLEQFSSQNKQLEESVLLLNTTAMELRALKNH